MPKKKKGKVYKGVKKWLLQGRKTAAEYKEMKTLFKQLIIKFKTCHWMKLCGDELNNNPWGDRYRILI